MTKKKTNAVWDKISTLLKKGLIVRQCMMINTLKLKYICAKIK